MDFVKKLKHIYDEYPVATSNNELATMSQQSSLPTPVKSPKERFQDILLEIFDLIEGSVPEGVYLQVAEQLKQANNELNALTIPAVPFGNVRIIQLVSEARQNTYYRRFRNKPTKARHHLTEAQKAKHTDYHLCSCGRYINHRKNTFVLEHLETQVHYQGLRNKKLSAKKATTSIDDEIKREVCLTAFCLNHICEYQQDQEQEATAVSSTAP